MSREHAAFEALAGAVALGEANAAERSAFAEHAAACTMCDDDAGTNSPLERLRSARDAESWRPEVGDPLLARIRETRSKNVRRTFGALGYAAGLSIVLNLAVASGFADRLYDRFEEASRPLPQAAAAPRIGREPVRSGALVSAVPHYIQRPLTAAIPRRTSRAHARDAGGRLGDVPDVLAGLVQPAAVTASRDVAEERFLLCDRGSDLGPPAACETTRADQPR